LFTASRGILRVAQRFRSSYARLDAHPPRRFTSNLSHASEKDCRVETIDAIRVKEFKRRKHSREKVLGYT
jgi:hypothetical protein